MQGGVILFRGSGTARRCVEANRSRTDEYYLGSDDVATNDEADALKAPDDAHGLVIAMTSGHLGPDQAATWLAGWG